MFKAKNVFNAPILINLSYVCNLKCIYNNAFIVTPILNPAYFLLLATFLFQPLSPLDSRSSRSSTTLRNLGGSYVVITCLLVVAGRRAIYFPDEI